MADIRYFSDYNNESIECTWITAISNEEFAIMFPGVVGRRYDGYSKVVGNVGGYGYPVLPITRQIQYKSEPSKHKCSAKCLNGKVTGVCECSCGGKNHGHSSLFTRLITA